MRHLRFGVGDRIRAPDGTESRVLVRDTWNTDMLPQLAPEAFNTSVLTFLRQIAAEAARAWKPSPSAEGR